jgi:hypothetical protein
MIEDYLTGVLQQKCIIHRLPLAINAIGILPTNQLVPNWQKRDVYKIRGICLHQAMSEHSVLDIARYHISRDCHLRKGGVYSISYTIGIDIDGTIIICNHFDDKTWSQGYAAKKGDENALWMAILIAGNFTSLGHKGRNPSVNQVTAIKLLWETLADYFDWYPRSIMGHAHFGKPHCPGTYLLDFIENEHQKTARYELNDAFGRQRCLNELGYYNYKIDGLWGDKSKYALNLFNLKHFIDSSTWTRRTSQIVRSMLRPLF